MKSLKEAYEKQDVARESIINLSRDIIRLSKKVITSVHNESIPQAEEHWAELEKKVDAIKKQKEVADSGSYTIAMQEAVEALLLLEYAKKGTIISYEDSGFQPNEYILGLCDFVGELQRRAVLKISKGDSASIAQIYKDVTLIYDTLLNYSFRGELRKKFDSVKYIMIRLEDLLAQLKMKSM